MMTTMLPGDINDVFYDNCRNSHMLISEFSLSKSGHTHEFIINAMRQQARVDNL